MAVDEYASDPLGRDLDDFAREEDDTLSSIPELGDDFSVADEDAWQPTDLVVLAGLTLLAAVMRLYGLSEWSMWVDEAHTFRDAAMPLRHFVDSNVRYYPIPAITLRVALEWFPQTEGWMRLPFAFAGIMTVPLLAIVGRGIVGRRAAWIAALLLALSPWHLYWSQNVRGYSIMLLFATGAVGVFWSAVQRGSIVLYAIAVVTAFLAGLAHPTGHAMLVVFGVVAFVLLWTRPGIYRTGLVVWAIVVTVGAGFGAIALTSDLWTWVHAAKSAPSFVHFAATCGFFFGLPLTAAAVLAVIALRHGPDRGGVVFCAIWAAAPVVVIGILSLGLFQVTAQYALCALPAACLLAGALGAAVADRVGRTSRMTALGAAVPVVVGAAMLAQDFQYYTHRHGERPRWREAAEAIDLPGDGPALVLTTNEPSMRLYLEPDSFRYGVRDDARYHVRSIESWHIKPMLPSGPEDEPVDVNRRGGGEPPPPSPAGVITVADGEDYMRLMLLEARALERRLLVIATEPELDEKDPAGGCLAWLRRNGSEIAQLPAWVGPKNMTVHVWEVPSR